MSNETKNQLILSLPPNYSCVNCGNEGTVNEIHIYSSTNVFERSVTILDALCEIFASPLLFALQNGKVDVIMCNKCAETVSSIYQSFTNLLCLSTPSSYLAKIFTQIESFHNPKVADDVELQETTGGETYNLYSYDVSDVYDQDKQDHYETTIILNLHEQNSGTDSLTLNYLNSDSSTVKQDVYHQPSSCDDTFSSISKLVLNTDFNFQSQPKGKYVCKNINRKRYYKCHLCPLEVTQMFELHEHIFLLHEFKTKSKCPKCPFTYFPEIIKHETHRCMTDRERNLVKKNRRYLCNICGVRFGGQKFLYFHQEKEHVQEDIRFKCNYCSKNLVDRHKLYSHLEIHTDTKAYLCSDCGKSFSQKRGLDKHLEIHTIDFDIRVQRRQEKQAGEFPCTVCLKIFKYKRNLLEHQRMHFPDSNKHRCPICDKPNWTRARLEKHKTSHEPKPYPPKLIKKGQRHAKGEPKKINQRKEKAEIKCEFCQKKFLWNCYDDHVEDFHQNELMSIETETKDIFERREGKRPVILVSRLIVE